MERGGVYNNSPMANVLLKDHEKIPSEILDSTLWVPNSSSSFHAASASMVSFEDENKTERQIFSQFDNKMENCNEDFDNCYHQPGKKRRLTPDQVQFLERSFDMENKLEPERKIQLAKEVALQPRQVAIWFQNRRARSKTKVLEKEYDNLKGSYDKLKADYDTLCKENENMKNEVNSMTEKLLMRENKKGKPEVSDPIISPIDSQPKRPNFSPDIELIVPCKQEDASSSAKSDVLDSDSPHCNNNHHHSAAAATALLEPANSSHVFEQPEVSDFSQDEDDDSFSRSLLPTSIFPKIEDEFYDDLQPNSCNLGFLVQDQGTWFWQY